MLEKVHEHLLAEIELGNRTDIIVVVTAVLFNIISLCSNSMVAAIWFNLRPGEVSAIGINLYLGVFVLLTVLFNVIALAGLLAGRSAREKLLTGLLAMYSDNNVDRYYDKTLISNYRTRYIIFGGVTIIFAIAAIILPLILRLLRI